MRKELLLSLMFFAISGCVYVDESGGDSDDELVRRASLDDVDLYSSSGVPVFELTIDARLETNAEVAIDSIVWEADDNTARLTFEPGAIEITDTMEQNDRRHEVRYRGALGVTIDDVALCDQDGELTIEIRFEGDGDSEDRTLREDVEYDCN